MVHKARRLDADLRNRRQRPVDGPAAAGRSGDEIVLTRHGQAAVRLVPIRSVLGRKKLLEAVRTAGAAKATPGPEAARSQDFLYGEDGLLE